MIKDLSDNKNKIIFINKKCRNTLNHLEMAVYMMMLFNIDDSKNTKNSFINIRELADKCRMRQEAVKNSLASLQIKHKIIKPVGIHSKEPWHDNEFEISDKIGFFK